MKHNVIFAGIILSVFLCACGQREQPPPEPPRSLPTGRPAVSAPPAEASAAPDASPGSMRLPAATPAPRVIRFETPLTISDSNRVKNIRLVARKLSGKRIEPGVEFSFNRVVGARTVKAGYRKATIFVDGEKKKDTGGGVCQVSTTLYNAALEAGFLITERHEHSREVDYVEEDRDATVDYGHLDLRFINRESNSYEISCEVKNDAVIVTLTECLKE